MARRVIALSNPVAGHLSHKTRQEYSDWFGRDVAGTFVAVYMPIADDGSRKYLEVPVVPVRPSTKL
jgi:hypothetical protein